MTKTPDASSQGRRAFVTNFTTPSGLKRPTAPPDSTRGGGFDGSGWKAPVAYEENIPYARTLLTVRATTLQGPCISLAGKTMLPIALSCNTRVVPTLLSASGALGDRPVLPVSSASRFGEGEPRRV